MKVYRSTTALLSVWIIASAFAVANTHNLPPVGLFLYLLMSMAYGYAVGFWHMEDRNRERGIN